MPAIRRSMASIVIVVVRYVLRVLLLLLLLLLYGFVPCLLQFPAVS